MKRVKEIRFAKGILLAALFILGVLLCYEIVFAQQAGPKYQVSCKDDKDTSAPCNQYLRLKNAQLEAIQLLQAAVQAQQNYMTAIKKLTDMGVEVRKENGWPDTVQFEPNSLAFSEAAPTAPQPKNAPPEEKP